MSVVEVALNSVDLALQSAADARQAEANAIAQDRAHRRRQFLEILCRSRNPKAGDESKLAELILSLELSTEEVRRLSSQIADAERKITFVNNQEEADALYADALQAVRDTEERHREELKAANEALHRASYEARRGGWMAQDLAKLLNEAPELFEDGLLELPEAVARIVGKRQPPREPVKRREPVYRKQINGRFVEPVLGDDGHYLRDERGAYVFPVAQLPEPLLDDKGRPRVGPDGKFVFPASTSPAPVTQAEPDAVVIDADDAPDDTTI